MFHDCKFWRFSKSNYQKCKVRGSINKTCWHRSPLVCDELLKFTEHRGFASSSNVRFSSEWWSAHQNKPLFHQGHSSVFVPWRNKYLYGTRFEMVCPSMPDTFDVCGFLAQGRWEKQNAGERKGGVRGWGCGCKLGERGRVIVIRVNPNIYVWGVLYEPVVTGTFLVFLEWWVGWVDVGVVCIGSTRIIMWFRDRMYDCDVVWLRGYRGIFKT